MDTSLIPREITDLAGQFFPSKFTNKALSHLKSSRINVSFLKGSPERFFIISGIISDGNTHSAQVSYKNKDENKSLTSSCDCTQWTEREHCPHTAALFIKFHLIKLNENGDQKQVAATSNIYGQYGQGVHAQIYGAIVRDANKLQGAHNNSTFASLQYILRNRKIINFPLATDLKDILGIQLIPALKLEQYATYPNAKNLYYPLFYLKNAQDGQVNKFISVFESLYAFDWEAGNAFNLPLEVKNLLKRINAKGLLQPINNYLVLLQEFFDSTIVEIAIDDKALKNFKYEKIQFRFNIEKSDRNNYLKLALELFNEKKQLVRPPTLFKLLTQENGLLSSFRAKTDAQNFLNFLNDSLEHNDQEYRKKCHSSSKRGEIIELIEHIQNQKETYFIDPIQSELYFIDHKEFSLIVSALVKGMGDSVSRFAEYLVDERIINFHILKNTLFQGISTLYQTMQIIGASIFYNQNEVKNWTSGIRFEREKNNLNWFDLNLIINDKDYKIIKNADLGENFILSENNLVVLSDKEKELLKFMKKYTSLEAQKKSLKQEDGLKKFALKFKRARIFELFELKKHGIDGALTPEEEELCNQLINLKEMPQFDVPNRYQNIAREYQTTGYQWLRFLYENKFGACLADDMGLGKTLQTIMLIQSVYHQVSKVLIVCPVSLLINWEKEIERFSDMNVHVYYGGEREKCEQSKIILTSYGVMKKEATSTFKDDYFDILIMDEVQHLKNIRSLGANAARSLNAGFRICLTGTPVENDLSEFYNIMDLSIPGIWGEISFIRSSTSKKNRLLARQTVRPFLLRRTKDQVLKELPPKEEHHVFLNFNDHEKSIYIQELAKIRDKIENMPQGRKYGEILKSLLQLRQLCLWQKKQKLDSTKIEFLIETLEQIQEENHKSIIFSQFTTYLDIIQAKLQERGWKFARIDGSKSLKKRGEAVEEFQNGDAKIFLISLKAGGVGLNLTAASYIFLMDPWWNPAVENQAIDRAHRIGQENKVIVYRPIIKDSVEEKVLILQNHKKELFSDLMGDDNEDFYSGKLSMEDFQALLS